MLRCRAPSLDACYRFTRKLREFPDALAACIDATLASLSEKIPAMGERVAIDGSDLPAYANGQRYVSAKSKIERKRFSDPDASWGHRSSISTRKGGGFYGYKVHAVVDVATDHPHRAGSPPAKSCRQRSRPTTAARSSGSQAVNTRPLSTSPASPAASVP